MPRRRATFLGDLHRHCTLRKCSELLLKMSRCKIKQITRGIQYPESLFNFKGFNRWVKTPKDPHFIYPRPSPGPSPPVGFEYKAKYLFCARIEAGIH